MSASTDALPARKVRPFYWSLRRELWENRALYLAPLAVAAVVLAGDLFAGRHLPGAVRLSLTAAPHSPAARQAHFGAVVPFDIAAAGIMMTALIVGAFYALGSLHNERRDRSILFWKSLPVSDLVTVLSKAAAALVVLPVAAAVTAMATVALMYAWAAAVLGANGVDIGVFNALLHPEVLLVVIPYGMACVALWYAPIVGWLMVISAWAKRMTFVWAVAPPAALCIFERLAVGTGYLWNFLLHRLAGGFDVGFKVKGDQQITSLDQLDPLAVVTSIDVWGGLAFLAACLALCVWLRRRRDPI
jgi:ABC-2 type transport system permease protein